MKTNKYAALLRGINVGGSGVIKMNELAGIFEKSGCRNVKTYIQSGNVVFETGDSASVKSSVSNLIKRGYGFEPVMIVYSKNEFEGIIRSNPYPAKEGNRVHLFFTAAEAGSPDLNKLNSLKAAGEEYKIINNVFYLYAPQGIGRSKLAASVEKCLGVPVTARNLNTAEKICTLLGG